MKTQSSNTDSGYRSYDEPNSLKKLRAKDHHHHRQQQQRHDNTLFYRLCCCVPLHVATRYEECPNSEGEMTRDVLLSAF